MTAKLKIDLSNGVIEAEGSESFVMSVYSDFKERVSASRAALNSTPPSVHQPLIQAPRDIVDEKKASSKGANSPQAKAGKKSAKSMPTIQKDLDLSGGDKCERLKDFHDQFAPGSNLEHNLIFVYYLQQKLHMTGITTDSIFTCYRHVGGIKTPTALRQSLIDTSNRRGWLDTSDMENISLTMVGINHLEHDLPRKTLT